MSLKVTICGKNRTTLPNSGCSECTGLERRIALLEDWVAIFTEDGYTALANKPSINGITVVGAKSSEDYLIERISNATIIELTPIE